MNQVLTPVFLLLSLTLLTRLGFCSEADREEIQKELNFQDMLPMVAKLSDMEERFAGQRKEMEIKMSRLQDLPVFQHHWNEIDQAFKETKQSLKDALSLRTLMDSEQLKTEPDSSVHAEMEKLQKKLSSGHSYSSLFDKEKIDLRNWFSRLYDAIALFESTNDSLDHGVRCSRSALSKLKEDVRSLAREAHIVLEP